MNKFNVGDKVKLKQHVIHNQKQEGITPTDWYCYMLNGGVAKVTEIVNSGTQLVVQSCGFTGKAWMYCSDVHLVEGYDPCEAIPPEVVALGDKLVTTQTGWTDKHYDAIYKLTEKDIERGWIKIDPYRVSKQWRLGSKDESGALFHVLKTLARIGEKNSVEREVRALLAQIKCFAEIEGIDYE